MTIQAVVFDIGGILEITPDLGWAPAWESRLGLAAGEIGERMADAWRGGEIGTVSEAEVHQAARERLGLDEGQLAEFMADLWRDYLGTANTELIEYARLLRPRYRTGILSNSFVGAREREQAAYGFEDLVDELVYSHECGLSKPDPGTYALVCSRLEVEPAQTVFLDDHEPNVEGARQAGLHAVLYSGQRPGHQRHRGAPGQKFNIMIIPNGPLAPPARPAGLGRRLSPPRLTWFRRRRGLGPGDGELVTAADALEPGGDAVLDLPQAPGVSGFRVQGQRAGGGAQGAAPPAEVDDPFGSG